MAEKHHNFPVFYLCIMLLFSFFVLQYPVREEGFVLNPNWFSLKKEGKPIWQKCVTLSPNQTEGPSGNG